MGTQFAPDLSDAALTAAERRVLKRFVAMLRDEFGEALLAVWLYGSRARGGLPRADSDVDLLVIAAGNVEIHQRKALDLSEAAALAEGENPFTYSVHVYDSEWLRGRRKIESFFIGEVDRDKLVLAGSGL